MPFGTITSTSNTFGSISGDVGANVPGTLSGSVGVPGPQGIQGPAGSQGPQGVPGVAGPGVPAGGLTNQFLVKASNLDYATAWTTFSLAGYATESWVTSQGYLTSSALTGYATQSFVASNYAPIAAGLPTGGTVGQVLTKQSGADFDDSWQTLIPGDRYLTSSTTSLTINNANKTLTVGTGLSYSSQQDVVIAHDAANHMHARVLTYNSGTGVMDVDVLSHSGAGTYATWTVNVGGAPALASVVWGDITGTLGAQGDLADALNAKLETTTAATTYAALSGATFTGKINTPAATTASAFLSLPHGTAPTTPVNGDIWSTTTGLVGRFNGFTRTMAQREGNNTFSAGAKQTFTNSSTTVGASLAPIASDPSTLANGDIWVNSTTNDLKVRLNGVSETVAEQSWVTSRGYLTSAPVTSVASKTGAVSLVVGDISGAAPLASPSFSGIVDIPSGATIAGYATESFVTSQGYLTDAPSDGSQYARKNGAWDVVSAGTSYITSVTTPLSVTSGDLSIDLSAYETAANAAATYYPLTNPNNFLTTFDATSTYYPLTNPEGYITAGALAPYAPAASPVLTGNVTITSNSTGAALFIQQAGTGNILTLHDQAADTTFVAIDANGKINTIPADATTAGLNIPHTATAPTTPVNGDVWSTTGGIFWRQNGATQQACDLGGTQTIGGNKTFSNANLTLGNSTAAGTINVGTGATISGSTKTVNIGTSGVSGSTTNIAIGSTTGTSTTTLQGNLTTTGTQISIGSSVSVTSNYFIGNGPLSTGQTRTIAIGNNGQTGSTNNITIGSAAGTSTTTLNGTVNATTATAGTNTTQIATTAFVTAAVPALATLAESRQFTNDTKVMSPRDVLWSMLSQDFIDIDGGSMTVTNTGTISHVQVGQLSRSIRPSNAGACSSRIRTFGPSQVDQTWTSTSRAQPASFLNFSLRSIHSGRSTTSGVADANYTCAVYYGKAEADGVGDLTRRGYGWKMVGGAGSRFLQLQAHNGTTLSSVTSSFAVTSGVAFDWDIESDGAGNVTLYVNGSSVATSTGGPTGSVNITGVAWQEEVVAAAALSSPFIDFTNSRGRFIVINSW